MDGKLAYKIIREFILRDFPIGENLLSVNVIKFGLKQGFFGGNYSSWDVVVTKLDSDSYVGRVATSSSFVNEDGDKKEKLNGKSFDEYETIIRKMKRFMDVNGYISIERGTYHVHDKLLQTKDLVIV